MRGATATLKPYYMKLIRLFIAVSILFWGLTGSAQQSINHFSLFDMAPLTLNPAYTGTYEGTLRIGGIYRDQWGSFLPNQFTTPSFYVDAPFLLIRNRDWLGAGVALISDKSGSGELGNTAVMGSVSYHLALDKKSTNVLTFGVQLGSVRRSINQSGLRFGDELGRNGAPGGSPDRNRIGENVNYLDVGAGVLLRSQLNETMGMELGFSLLHLTTPAYNLISENSSNPNQDLPAQFILHGRYRVDMSEKWLFSPAFLFQGITGANEIAIQGNLGYKLNPDNPTVLKGGVGYRLRDAIQILLGLDYGDLSVGLSYDANISDLTKVSNTFGGFEVAVAYIIKIYKQPDVKPAFMCPRI